MLREGNGRRDFTVIDYVFYIIYYDTRILWAKLEGVKMSHKVADKVVEPRRGVRAASGDCGPGRGRVEHAHVFGTHDLYLFIPGYPEC